MVGPRIEALRRDMPTVKPRLRGRLHQAMFWVSIPAGAVVVFAARSGLATLGAALYAVSLLALFGASAAYHRGSWTPPTRTLMQRLDRAMIFVLIAGSYTPIVLIALKPSWGITLLALAWTCAVVGVTLTLVRWDFVNRHGGYLYVAFGWLIVVALPLIVHSLSPVEFALLLTSGIVYTVGAIGFGLHRPLLNPEVFGYHEAWHVMTVIAAACHYALVLMLVRA